ncbi:MAG TPA: MarR family transcriptional regulator [Jatrophihabitans sp.]|uniref:MarR family winged helix-turn-helix transcriptional regulator n=1 Tax=Jatrophihabitans sp. TaxID=1932789 RepID=UPI002E098B12|nr:MarR family transcriptional regulator [Jatrophihabitans sp.]
MTGRTRRDTDEFVDAVLTASRVLVAVSARSLAEVADSTTVVQFRTLVVLRMRPDTNLHGLAEALAVNSSTALRMVDRLVVAGLVARRSSPESRREVRLALTDTGAALVDEVTARRRAEITRIVRTMPAHQRAELAPALRAFAQAADEPPVAGGVTAFGW